MFSIRIPSGAGMPHRQIPPDVARLLAEDRLLTMAQVASVLGLPTYTVRDYARRGTIPTIRLGRRVYVMALSLHRWLREREHGGDST